VIEDNTLLNCYVARTEYRRNYWATGILLHLEQGANTISVVGNHFSGCECRKNGEYTAAYITGDAITANETSNVCDGSVRRIFEWQQM